MILEHDLLNQIYQKWYYGTAEKPRWPKTYNKGYRDQRFEDWLWAQGFTVVQQNKQRYLKFSGDDRNLTLFLLKWG